MVWSKTAQPAVTFTPASSLSYLLQENGDYLLQEDGSKIALEWSWTKSAQPATTFTKVAQP